MEFNRDDVEQKFHVHTRRDRGVGDDSVSHGFT